MRAGFRLASRTAVPQLDTRHPLQIRHRPIHRQDRTRQRLHAPLQIAGQQAATVGYRYRKAAQQIPAIRHPRG